MKISDTLTRDQRLGSQFCGRRARGAQFHRFRVWTRPGAGCRRPRACLCHRNCLAFESNVIDSSGFSRSAALFFVSPLQINFLVPEGTAAGTPPSRSDS